MQGCGCREEYLAWHAALAAEGARSGKDEVLGVLPGRRSTKKMIPSGANAEVTKANGAMMLLLFLLRWKLGLLSSGSSVGHEGKRRAMQVFDGKILRDLSGFSFYFFDDAWQELC